MHPALHLKPRVPIEVAERIIDQFGDNQHGESSLRNCALVCQAWLPRSRVNLFRTVHIVDLRTMRSLHRLLVSTDTLRSLVHCVDLEGVPMYADGEDSTVMSTSDTFDIAPLVLFTLLPNLRSCTFRCSSVEHYSLLQMRTLVLAYLPRHTVINNLSLVDIHVQSKTDLVRLLLALPSLQSLHIRDISIYDEGLHLDRFLDRLVNQLRPSDLQVKIMLYRTFSNRC